MLEMPPNKVWVTAVTNPFKPHDPASRIIEYIDHKGEASLRAYMNEIFPLMPVDLDVEVVVNGLRIEPEEIEGFIPAPGNSVVFCVVPQGGGDSGNKILRTVAMVAVIIISIYAPYAAPASWGMVSASGTVTMGGAMLSAGIAIAGSLIVNAILPPVIPDMDIASMEGTSSSPTYGWGIKDNRDIEGFPFPVLYGTMRVFPPVLARFISFEGDKQYINKLYAVADHEVDSITDIEINGNPSANYPEMDITTRLGTNGQTVIPYFADTISEAIVGTIIPTDGTNTVSQRTSGTAVEGLIVGIIFPQGLWYANDEGSLSEITVEVQISHKIVGGAWVDWDVLTVSGAESSVIQRTARKDNLAAGEYDVRVKYVIAQERLDGSRYSNTGQFSFLQEVVPDDFEYPGTALVAIKALATDQLSGAEPRLSCIVARSTVPVYDSGWTTKDAANPAWAAYDMYVNSLYGSGVNYSRMLLADFTSWATECSSESRVFNAYIDTPHSFPEIVSWPETFGRARVVQKGTDFGVIIDKATNPVMMFDMGNIVENSFKESFLSTDERANVVEITYFDEALEYSRQTLELKTYDFDTNTDLEDNRIQVVLYGCTSRASAIKHAQFILNCNRYFLRTVEFEVGVDALGCQAGDVIHISHDMPQWGYSGRIISATANTAVLDREVTLTPGTSYQIIVLHNTDVLETQALTTPGVETTSATLNLTGVWTKIPSLHDNYSFGALTFVTKEFRVFDITRGKEQNRRVKALEYVADVYNDTANIPDGEAYPSLTFVTALTATEFWREQDQGKGVIHLAWRGEALKWHVFYRVNGTTHWIKAGETTNPSYDVYYLNPGTTYNFAVSGRDNPDYGEEVTETFYGWGNKISRLPIVGALQVDEQGNTGQWTDENLKLRWNIISETFEEGAGEAMSAAWVLAVDRRVTYMLRVYDSDGTTLRRERHLEVNRYDYTLEKNIEDGLSHSLVIKVWAIDYEGNYSEVPAILEVTNPVPTTITGLRLRKTGSTTEWSGVDVDLIWTATDIPDFKHYKLTINPGRTVYIPDQSEPTFVYTHRMSMVDGSGTSASTLVIEVIAVDMFDQESVVVNQITITNPPPVPVIGLTAYSHMRAVRFVWTSNSEEDMDGYWYRERIESEPWTVWKETPLNTYTRTLSQTEVDTYETAAIHFEVKAVDTIGSLSIVQSISGTTLDLNVDSTDITDFAVIASKLFMKVPVLSGDAWTDNSPVIEKITWNEHTIYYNGAAYTIAAGNSSLHYIYWQNGDAEYSASNEVPDLNDGDFIIATNIEGAHDLAWNAIANQVIGSAYIGLLAVKDANIESINADKIVATSLSAISANLGTVTAGSLTAVTITSPLIQTNDGVGKKIIIDEDGIRLQSTDNTGKYGANVLFDDGVLFGSGALAYIHHSAYKEPFYVSTEQAVGDFRLVPRTTDPSSVDCTEGSLAVVNDQLKLATADGNANWETIGPCRSAFLVTSAAQNNIATGARDVVYSGEIKDIGNDFNTGTYTFTAPQEGLYLFNFSLQLYEMDVDANYIQLSLVTTDKTFYWTIDPLFSGDPAYYTATFSVLAEMDKDDTAKVQINQNGGAVQMDYDVNGIFSGHWVCD